MDIICIAKEYLSIRLLVPFALFAVYLLWIIWRFTIAPALHPREPRTVRYWIPGKFLPVADATIFTCNRTLLTGGLSIGYTFPAFFNTTPLTFERRMFKAMHSAFSEITAAHLLKHGNITPLNECRSC